MEGYSWISGRFSAKAVRNGVIHRIGGTSTPSLSVTSVTRSSPFAPSGAHPRTGVAGLDADTKRIMKAITKLLPSEAREQREPTEAELALTYPPGYSGDPERESERRPGTD